MLVDFSFSGYFIGADHLLFFLFGFVLVFSPNSDLTCPPPYYLPSWPYLPIYNQTPSFSPTYYNLFTPTHFLDFHSHNLYVYNLPNTLLPTCRSAMLLPTMNILTMQVLQCHIPNSLPTHPRGIEISKFKYVYASGVYVREPHPSITFQKSINYPNVLSIYICIYPYVTIGIP
jgi:hypothetical protein